MPHENHTHDEWVEQAWRTYLTRGESRERGVPFLTAAQLRRLMRALPKNPRCRLCYAPFAGIGATITRHMLGRGPSQLNPQICDVCENFARTYQGGAEVDLTVLFADVRGSTRLAEQMGAREFSRLINRFFNAATQVLFDAGALVEKLTGDGVTGLFAPGLAGAGHALRAVQAGRAILRATGHTGPGGPWAPVGIGIHTGPTYVGTIGSAEGIYDIAALGDTANTGARLSGEAQAGEILISAATLAAAGLDPAAYERRSLQLKGKTTPFEAWSLSAGETVQPGH